jgi:hypothetical protein
LLWQEIIEIYTELSGKYEFDAEMHRSVAGEFAYRECVKRFGRRITDKALEEVRGIK